MAFLCVLSLHQLVMYIYINPLSLQLRREIAQASRNKRRPSENEADTG